jgi:myo-inositol-1(or 4)-monophosphatase
VIEIRAETAAAIDVVWRALAMVDGYAGSGEITSKGVRDIVTAADVAVEDLVRGHLGDVLGQPVVGEEHGGEPPADGSPYWLVDPICGTSNFASGMPLFCVNLALVEDGVVTAGVVGDPSRDEVVYAERGGGAWVLKHGDAGRLSVNDDSTTLVIEDGKAGESTREHAARFITETIRADRWEFRSLGSTLALPYLAAGRIAAYVVFYATALHCAAGSLLVSEAGGVLSDLEGKPWTLDSTSLLFAAGPDLHVGLQALAASTRP